MSARPEAPRLALSLALAACGLLGCRSAARSGSDDVPVRIGVGAGSPDAVARRSARELADSPVLAELAPRAGAGDRRFAVRIDSTEVAGSSASAAFQSMLVTALVATGSFLIVEDPGAPAVHVRVSAASGDPETRVWVSGTDGEPWVDVRGSLWRPN